MRFQAVNTAHCLSRAEISSALQDTQDKIRLISQTSSKTWGTAVTLSLILSSQWSFYH
jgi:hypothetical protein